MVTPEQAFYLYRQINNGTTVGVDLDSNVVREDTKLAICLEIIGIPSYVAFSHTDKSNRKIFDVKRQVAFLREWADALEKLGPQDGN